MGMTPECFAACFKARANCYRAPFCSFVLVFVLIAMVTLIVLVGLFIVMLLFQPGLSLTLSLVAVYIFILIGTVYIDLVWALVALSIMIEQKSSHLDHFNCSSESISWV